MNAVRRQSAFLALPVVFYARLERSRWYRPISFGLTVVLVALAGLRLYGTWTVTFAHLHGNDIRVYMAATQRWLDTGTPYVASEVAGPFAYGPQTFLHPPIALLLFAPFRVLPFFLWWAIPVAIVIIVLVSFRPAPWAWVVMAVGLAWPTFSAAFAVGNSDLWVWAALAVGLRWSWPAALIAVKPTFVVLAFLGAKSRWWWVTAATMSAVGLLFGSLWFDWLLVIINSPGGLLYSVGSLPWIMIPAVAWASRTREVPQAVQLSWPAVIRVPASLRSVA